MDVPKPFGPEISSGWLANLAQELTPAWLPAAAGQSPLGGAEPRSAGASFFGPYEILAQIGRGGVAEVMRVRHVHPQFANRPTALKILQRQAGDDARIVELFRREAGVHSLIRHDNIVETFEAGVHDNRPYLAMAFVAGGDMDHLLGRLKAKRMRLEPALCVYIVCEILLGLEFAHSLRDLRDRPLGLVHRDVNPANIFLSFDGCVRLGDFGVASLAHEKRRGQYEIAGKPGYFAPEHLAGKPIDGRADVFAVGATLFELLSGGRLFVGKDDDAVMQQNERVELPDLAASLSGDAQHLVPVLATALARDPRERFQSADAMRTALLPYVAPRAPSQMLLRSLVQHFFAGELTREENIVHGGRDPRRALVQMWQAQHSQVPRLVLAMGEPNADRAMAGLLEPLGFAVAAANDEASWRQLVARSPALALLACPGGPGQQTFVPEAWGTWRDQEPKPSLIVSATEFSLANADFAVQAQAADLWIRPFPASRALQGIGEVLRARLPATVAGRASAAGASGSVVPLGRALLAVGPAAKAVVSACRLLPGDRVTYAADAAAAIGATAAASFDALIIDAMQVPDVGAFLARFRATIGMGPVPAVATQLATTLTTLTLPRFSVLTEQGDLLAAIERAQRGNPGQELRAYTRFDARLPVQLRCAGQVVDAETVNISRRGLLLSTPFLPSVGSDLGLRIVLPPAAPGTESPEVFVAGRAQRAVVRPQADQSGALAPPTQLGIALGRFASGTEAQWVRFILAQVPAPDGGLLARAARWLGGAEKR